MPSSTEARVQFRLPGGDSRQNSFAADAPLSELYKFVKDQIDLEFSSFSLTTSFPRRNLDSEDMTSSLRTQGLAPSGVVLVLPRASPSSQSVIPCSNGSDLWSYIWLILTPLSFLWNLVASFFQTSSGGTRTGEDSSPVAPSSSDPMMINNYLKNMRYFLLCFFYQA